MCLKNKKKKRVYGNIVEAIQIQIKDSLLTAHFTYRCFRHN